MEKLIVERVNFIKEESYQKIKKILNKKGDFFCEQEFRDFNAILMQRHRYFKISIDNQK